MFNGRAAFFSEDACAARGAKTADRPYLRPTLLTYVIFEQSTAMASLEFRFVTLGLLLILAGAAVAYRGIHVTATASPGLGALGGGISSAGLLGILALLSGIGLLTAGMLRRRVR